MNISWTLFKTFFFSDHQQPVDWVPAYNSVVNNIWVNKQKTLLHTARWRCSAVLSWGRWCPTRTLRRCSDLGGTISGDVVVFSLLTPISHWVFSLSLPSREKAEISGSKTENTFYYWLRDNIIHPGTTLFMVW